MKYWQQTAFVCLAILAACTVGCDLGAAHELTVLAPEASYALTNSISVQLVDGTTAAHPALAGTQVLVYRRASATSNWVWHSSVQSDIQGRVVLTPTDLGNGVAYQLQVRSLATGNYKSSTALSAYGIYEFVVGNLPLTVTVSHNGTLLANQDVTAHEVLAGGAVEWRDGRTTNAAGQVVFELDGLDDGRIYRLRTYPPNGNATWSGDIDTTGLFTFSVGGTDTTPPQEPDDTQPAPAPSGDTTSSTSSPATCVYTPPGGSVFHVRTNGSNTSGNGSSASPWKTITHAISQVPDGATIVVGSGTYQGTTTLSRHFVSGVVIRSETPYKARLRTSTGQALRCYDCSGITMEGFDIAHSSSTAGPLVVHIQGSTTHHVTLRNNIIHDSYNNDLLKINNSAFEIVVERNIFYNQTGSDEHIDINSVTDVIVQDNIFFNDFAASGRTNTNSTSSFIVIKDSNSTDDVYLGASEITVRRNIFANWQGGSGYNFILVGEDAMPYIEARDILVENNLFLGNASNAMRAPLGCKSGERVTFRHNTVSGNLPASAFAMRLNVENALVQNRDIHFYNNIWSDPAGSMQRFSTTPFGQTATFELDNNAYWNGGSALPSRSDDLVNYTNDVHRVQANPLLTNPGGLIAPTYNGTTFASGSSDICDAFTDLVHAYGVPAQGSPVVNAARTDKAPTHDILGRLRSTPDIGAYER